MKRLLLHLHLLIIGGAIVTFSFLEMLPIAIVTHSSWGFFVSFIGVILGGSIATYAADKLLGFKEKPDGH